MARRIVVGTKECSVRDVAKNLRDSHSYHLLNEKWSDFARDLDLPEVQIVAWKQKLILDTLSFNSLIIEIISSWAGLKGSKATLDELMEALISNGMTAVAEELETKNPNQLGTIQGQKESNSLAILPNPVVATPEATRKNISSQSSDTVHFVLEGGFMGPEANIDNRPETSQQEENSALTILPVPAIPDSSWTNPSDEIIPVGSKISYFPGKFLGGGYMGCEVYEGIYEGHIHVAVKQLKKRFHADAETEVKLLCHADKHENVIRYYCNEVHGVYRYIVLELCQATLTDWVEKNNKGMEVQNITDLKILEQCVDGLMFIHEKDVVHRDLRPSNILLFKQSKDKIVVKISDFGLAKEIEGYHQCYSHSGSSGSLGWIAPEVIGTKIGSKIKATVDIFSLGCIFYNVVTRGGHPFGDEEDGITRQTNIKIGQFTISFSYSDISYNSRGMTNLIKLMINSSPNGRPPLSVVKSHPVFWSAKKVIRFSHEVKVLERNADAFVRKAFKELEILGKDSELVFKKNKNWTETVFDKIGIDFESKPYKLKNTVTDLNRFFRNLHQHRRVGHQPNVIKNASEEEYVSLWLEMFPQFLTCLWIVFKQLYDNGEQDFAEFYEDPINPFWSRTERFKLINNGLEVTETSTGFTVSFGPNGSAASTLPGPSTSSN